MTASKPEPYTGDGRVIERKDGYSVVYRPDSRWTPFFCPVCSVALLSADDEQTADDLGCCYRCAVTHAYPNIKAWRDGWRP